MASKPKRGGRGSMEFPPDFSELMNRLIKAAASFIKQFDSSEPRMTEIVGEFQKIAAEVKEMQQGTDRERRVGVFIGAIIFTIGAVGAPFTLGLSLAAIAAGAAGGGGAVIIHANITKIMTEKGSAKKVEELGTCFLEIAETLKEDLEEIKTTCEKLKERSAEAQAENSLSDLEDFQTVLRRVSELGRRTVAVVDVVVAVMSTVTEVVTLIVKAIQLRATPEEDRKFREAIIRSADQSQKAVQSFTDMKTELREFTGRE